MKLSTALLIILLFGSTPTKAESTNLRFSPITPLIGALSVSADFKLSDKFTLGPEGLYWNFDFLGVKVNAWSVGIRGNFFGNGVFQHSWYVGSSLSYSDVKASTTSITGSTVEAKGSGVALGVLGGYGWFWSSFNMMLGGGIAYSGVPTSSTVTESDGTTTDVEFRRLGGFSPLLEFTLGWYF